VDTDTVWTLFLSRVMGVVACLFSILTWPAVVVALAFIALEVTRKQKLICP
jgi:hypothetical protein